MAELHRGVRLILSPRGLIELPRVWHSLTSFYSQLFATGPTNTLIAALDS